LNLKDSFYDAQIGKTFFLHGLVPGCDDIIIDSTFGDIIYVFGVGHFIVDDLVYCDVRPYS